MDQHEIQTHLNTHQDRTPVTLVAAEVARWDSLVLQASTSQDPDLVLSAVKAMKAEAGQNPERLNQAKAIWTHRKPWLASFV